jgi:hypothetical protein
MIRSLQSMQRNAHMYVLALDDECAKMLHYLRLPNVSVIKLKDIETPILLQKKSERTVAEYCWTLTPVLLNYILKNYAIDAITYVDADLMFYNNPSNIIKSMGDNVILLTPHRYTPQFDNSERSGIYCVQFMCFKRHPKALKALSWWQDACIDWCFNRVEDGKFGDQKYLDTWPVKFKGVFICNDPGVGIAPWNIQQYILKKEANKSVLFYHGRRIQPIFYHYHGVRFYGDKHIELCQYPLKECMQKYFYVPYIQALLELENELKDLGSILNLHGKSHVSWNLSDKIKRAVGRAPKLYEYREFTCQN